MRADRQFLSINRRPVLRSRANKLLGELAASVARQHHHGGAVGRGSQSDTEERRGRGAVYCLDIALPLNAYDVTFEPAKTYVEFKVSNCLCL